MSLPDRLLVVTDRHQAPRDLIDVVDAALAGGVRWIWFRDRDLAAGERRDIARRLRDLTRTYGAVLTIGGDAGLAVEVGTPAVHLSSIDDIGAARALLGADALIGISAHNETEVQAAKAAGADYATLSPIFLTASKPGYGPALGTATLQRVRAIGLPVIALGGITGDRVPACLAAGAAGVAVMGDVMRAEDPEAVVLRFRAALDRPLTAS